MAATFTGGITITGQRPTLWAGSQRLPTIQAMAVCLLTLTDRILRLHRYRSIPRHPFIGRHATDGSRSSQPQRSVAVLADSAPIFPPMLLYCPYCPTRRCVPMELPIGWVETIRGLQKYDIRDGAEGILGLRASHP
jgi:hypothetical protein